jgi:membrane fusion protein
MNSLFRPEAVARQQQRLQGEVSLTRPPALVWLTWLISAIALTSLVFLISGDYQRKQTAVGLLQPEQGVVRLHTHSAGVVSKLLVKEGEQVVPGQPLVQLSSRLYAEGQPELTATLLQERQLMLEALFTQKQQNQQKHQLMLTETRQKISSLELQLVELNQQISTFRERLKLNQQQVQQLQKLNGTGYISEIELNRQRDLVLSLQQQDKVLAGQQLALAEQLSQQQSLLQQLPLQYQQDITQLEQQISEHKNQLARLQHEQSHVITAPVAGVISTLLVKAGQQLEQGAVALSLLPMDHQLEAVLYLPTRAIAFIEVGQHARIRYHAFPYQRFGVHQAKIIEISSTVLLPNEVKDVTLTEPSYRLRLQLSAQQIRAYNRELPLKAGMSLEADIVTEQRSLLQWLFDPIYSIQGRL